MIPHVTVWIGTEKNQRIPTLVAKHSLTRRASIPISVELLADIPMPFRTVTGFSFYRFLVPEKMQYHGTAIYADCDILWLWDVRDLLGVCSSKAPINAVPNGKEHWHTSLMVMDCSRLTHWLGSAWLPRCALDMPFYKSLLGAHIGGELFKDFTAISSIWNSMDVRDGATKNLHYTALPKQPWKRAGHAYGGVFRQELMQAMADGVVTIDDLRDEIKRGHVRPDVLEVI